MPVAVCVPHVVEVYELAKTCGVIVSPAER